MKHIKWVGLALLLVAVPMLAFAGFAHAEKFATLVEKGEVVNSTLYSAGKDVEINGVINGDIYCAGQTVFIDAVVHGDVICAGMDVTVAGKVDGNIRVAGQTVNVSAETTRSMTVAANTFSLDADAKVGKDMTIAGTTLSIKGVVGRDLVAAGSAMTVNNAVKGNIRFEGEDLTLRGGASVGGDVNYKSKNKATISSDAVVKGAVKQTVPKPKTWVERFNVFFYLYALVAMIVMTALVALVFPQALQNVTSNMKTRWSKNLLIGFAAVFGLPIAAVLLCMSVIGIPIAFTILLAWAVLVVASGPVAAYILGRLMWGNKAKNVVTVAMTGSFALTTLCFLPFVGSLFVFMSTWIGVGAVALALRKATPKPNYRIQK